MKHEEPFMLSMANRGKDSNGSQFFITTAPASHLDGVHVVFGKLTGVSSGGFGKELITRIENLKVNAKNRPVSDVLISGCGQLVKKTRDVSESASSDDSAEIDRHRKKKHKKEKKRERSTKKTAAEKNLPEEPGGQNKFLHRRSPTPERRDRRDQQTTIRTAKNGHKVKGRGAIRFRADEYDRSRSVTPPHWKREEQRLITLSELQKVRKQKKEMEELEAKRRTETTEIDTFGYRRRPGFELPPVQDHHRGYRPVSGDRDRSRSRDRSRERHRSSRKSDDNGKMDISLIPRSFNSHQTRRRTMKNWKIAYSRGSFAPSQETRQEEPKRKDSPKAPVSRSDRDSGYQNRRREEDSSSHPRKSSRERSDRNKETEPSRRHRERSRTRSPAVSRNDRNKEAEPYRRQRERSRTRSPVVSRSERNKEAEPSRRQRERSRSKSPAVPRSYQQRSNDQDRREDRGNRADRDQRRPESGSSSARHQERNPSPPPPAAERKFVESVPPPVQAFKSTKINLDEVLEKAKAHEEALQDAQSLAALNRQREINQRKLMEESRSIMAKPEKKRRLKKKKARSASVNLPLQWTEMSQSVTALAPKVREGIRRSPSPPRSKYNQSESSNSAATKAPTATLPPIGGVSSLLLKSNSPPKQEEMAKTAEKMSSSSSKKER
uniref:PPIase cyclophilin-type domain-containing protein n=1 Tax=Ditylenchus dipsaci TaxID=166011 RepID=A0A915EFY1_9BILA